MCGWQSSDFKWFYRSFLLHGRNLCQGDISLWDCHVQIRASIVLLLHLLSLACPVVDWRLCWTTTEQCKESYPLVKFEYTACKCWSAKDLSDTARHASLNSAALRVITNFQRARVRYPPETILRGSSFYLKDERRHVVSIITCLSWLSYLLVKDVYSFFVALAFVLRTL